MSAWFDMVVMSRLCQVMGTWYEFGCGDVTLSVLRGLCVFIRDLNDYDTFPDRMVSEELHELVSASVLTSYHSVYREDLGSPDWHVS